MSIEAGLARFLTERPWGQLQSFPSNRDAYEVCYAYEAPSAQKEGLHLDLANKRGIDSDGMAWSVYENGRESFGHAWDDSQADGPYTEIAFDDWVTKRIRLRAQSGMYAWIRANWAELTAADEAQRTLETLTEVFGHDPSHWRHEAAMLAACCAAALSDTELTSAFGQQAASTTTNDMLDTQTVTDFGIARLSASMEEAAFSRLFSPVIQNFVQRNAPWPRPFMTLFEMADSWARPAWNVIVDMVAKYVTDPAVLGQTAQAMVQYQHVEGAFRLLERLLEERPESAPLHAVYNEVAEQVGRERKPSPVDPITAEIAAMTREVDSIGATLHWGAADEGTLEKVKALSALEDQINTFWLNTSSVEDAILDRRFRLTATALVIKHHQGLEREEDACEWLDDHLERATFLHSAAKSDKAGFWSLMNHALQLATATEWEDEIERFVNLHAELESANIDLEYPLVRSELARLHCLAGNTKEALEQVRALSNKHSKTLEDVAETPDLEPLLELPEFKSIFAGSS